jgi:hypothetical protein
MHAWKHVWKQGNSLCSHLYLKLAKTSCFSFYLLLFFSTKPENRKAEQVLPGWEEVALMGGKKEVAGKG